MTIQWKVYAGFAYLRAFTMRHVAHEYAMQVARESHPSIVAVEVYRYELDHDGCPVSLTLDGAYDVPSPDATTT